MYYTENLSKKKKKNEKQTIKFFISVIINILKLRMFLNWNFFLIIFYGTELIEIQYNILLIITVQFNNNGATMV